jgi:hypothetical protein
LLSLFVIPGKSVNSPLSLLPCFPPFFRFFTQKSYEQTGLNSPP